MAVVLTDRGEFEVAATGGLRVSPGDAEAITGWTLKPEGMCRDELCVPLGDETRRDGKVDIAAFWRILGHPIVSDTGGEVWVLGTAADSRKAALTGLKRLILRCRTFPGCSTACPNSAARKSSSRPGRPGEAAALTCPCGSN